jgi:hypothetical protein
VSCAAPDGKDLPKACPQALGTDHAPPVQASPRADPLSPLPGSRGIDPQHRVTRAAAHVIAGRLRMCLDQHLPRTRTTLRFLFVCPTPGNVKGVYIMPSENTAIQSATRREIEEVIEASAEIANISAMRSEILARVRFPVDWQMQNSQAHLRPFADFFESILDPDSPSPLMRALVQKLASRALFRQCGWQARDIRTTPEFFDPRFNDAEDLIFPMFEVLFADREAGLLGLWMQEMDAHVTDVSRTTLQAMDEVAQRGQSPLRKDVVLVGGGPLTSIVASILGPYFQITVVTEQRALGKPWRNRPIFINSSCSVRDFNGAPLPLLGGTTTRVIGRGQWNNLETSLLLQTSDTLDVSCENGETARYAAGPRLGDLVATNIVMNADDYVVGQRVDIAQMSRNADGSLQIVLIDTEDGSRRTIHATACFMLTGPGPEQSKVTGVGSQRLYQAAAAQINSALREARLDLAQARASLKQQVTRDQAEEPLVLAERRKQASLSANRIARRIQRKIPRLLTLTAVEKVYELWSELEELGADPLAFPLADVLTTREAIAYIGNGDTARTLKELVDGNGPVCAYPTGWNSRRVGGRATIYNEEATSPEEYAAKARRRYGDVFTGDTRGVPQKASRYRLVTDKGGRVRVEVSYRDTSGKRHRNRYGYVFDATGLSRSPLEAGLPAAFQIGDVPDLAGVLVARGDARADLFIVGSANGALAPALPQALQDIVGVLGIPENTISLWVNGLLCERLAYTYLAQRPLTKTWPQRDREDRV